jgi:hypothetical protein
MPYLTRQYIFSGALRLLLLDLNDVVYPGVIPIGIGADHPGPPAVVPNPLGAGARSELATCSMVSAVKPATATIGAPAKPEGQVTLSAPSEQNILSVTSEAHLSIVRVIVKEVHLLCAMGPINHAPQKDEIPIPTQ